MFTGIVQACLSVKSMETKPGLTTLGIPMLPVLGDDLQMGASVAVDGVCLTVCRMEGEMAYFDAMVETLRKTTLGNLEEGKQVNVERSMKAGDEIGGHILSGHVMTTATIVKVEASENNRAVTFKVDPSWMKYIFPKGYVALDGCSLTLVDVDKVEGTFSVYFIPETLRLTVFGAKGVGDTVNVEIDAQTQAIVDTVENVLQDRLKETVQSLLSAGAIDLS